MDENPYEAPQEKPIDRPFDFRTWRIVRWASLAASMAVMATAMYFGVIREGLSLASFVVMLVMLALTAVGFFADQKVRRQIR